MCCLKLKKSRCSNDFAQFGINNKLILAADEYQYGLQYGTSVSLSPHI